MKTAVIYARYSSDRQTEQSIEGQLHVCKDYANRNNIVIVDTYIDRAMTGTNDNRLSFQKMLKDSTKKNWDMVLVYKLDRFSRNKYEMAIHKKTLRDNGVKLVSAMENIPDTPEGIILESLLEGMAEYYSAELAQKVNRGMRESWSKGNATGGKPLFGYKIENKKYVIHKEEAEIVKEMFTKYSIGYKAESICESLNERGLRLRNGKKFYSKYFYKLIHQEKYVGKATLQGVEYDNLFPRIISDDLWEAVNKIHEQNKLSNLHIKEKYNCILTNKLFCGVCGAKMTGDSGTSCNGNLHHYYSCPSRRRKLGKCDLKSIHKHKLEGAVINATMQLLETEENINMIAERVYKKHKETIKENVNLKMFERQLEEALRANQNLIAAMEKGIFNDMTKSRLDELQAEIDRLECEIQKEKSKQEIEITIEDIKQFLKSNIFENAEDIEISRFLIRNLIDKVILNHDSIIIIYNFINNGELLVLNKENVSETKKQIDSALEKEELFVIPRRFATKRIEKSTFFC